MSKNKDPRRCETALHGQKMTSNLKTLTHEAYGGNDHMEMVISYGDEAKSKVGTEAGRNAVFGNLDLILDGI